MVLLEAGGDRRERRETLPRATVIGRHGILRDQETTEHVDDRLVLHLGIYVLEKQYSYTTSGFKTK